MILTNGFTFGFYAELTLSTLVQAYYPNVGDKN